MSLRTARYSTDLLTAEVFAAPFWMPEAMSASVISLHPMVSRNEPTRRLFRATENYLLQRFPATNIDELTSVRDRLWFPNGNHHNVGDDGYPLHEVALAFARTLSDITRTEPDHSEHLFRQRRSRLGLVEAHSSRMRLFRRMFFWLSTSLPHDVLAAIVRVESSRQPGDRSIRLCASLLDSMGITQNVTHMLRSGGMAEPHLHLGAAFQFSDLWTALMIRIGSHRFLPDAFQSPGGDWDEGRRLARLCLHAGILRIVLAKFLASTAYRGREVPSIRFVDFAERLLERAQQAGSWSVVQEVRRALTFARFGQSGTSKFEFRAAQAAYRQLQSVGMPPKTLIELRRRDPISRYLDVRGPSTPEQRLVVLALTKMIERGDNGYVDQYFRNCFWQYQRIRNAVYRHVVHRPMSPGLQWFIRHFSRLSPTKKSVSTSVRLESAQEVSGITHGLRSLEVRTTPSPSFTETFQFVRDVYRFARSQTEQQADPQQPPLEVGLVFHLKKDRGGGAMAGKANANGMETASEPGLSKLVKVRVHREIEYGSVSRFHKFFHQTRRGVVHVAKTLRSFPKSLLVIRGFDACADELGIPNWVLVSFFGTMRRAAAEAQKAIQERFEVTVPLPRTTIHAGEDFVHILTGLRHLDESVEWLNLEEGDRIGHALALGVDASAWARDAGNVTMPAEERLFDLVWEWEFAGKNRILGSMSRLQFLESSITELSEFIFGVRPRRQAAYSTREADGLSWPPSPRQLSVLRRNLADPTMQKHAGLGIAWEHTSADRHPDLQLMREYLFRRDIFRRGQRNIIVNSDAWADDLHAIQNAVCERVRCLNVAVEVNPSSNLLLGDLGDLKRHPLWRMNSPEIAESTQALPIVVGSDDPVTFASNLPQEYQKLADVLSTNGFSEASSLDWLDRVRETSLRYRFTIPIDHQFGAELGRGSS